MSSKNPQDRTQNWLSTANTHAIIGGMASIIAYVYMAIHSRAYGDFTLEQLLLTSLICASISFWVWYVHTKQEQQINLPILLGFAVVFRLIGGFTFPILEDDFYRYLWDAYLSAYQGSAYGVPPADFFENPDVSEQFETILNGINYPFIETIYGPSCQWLFALAFQISPGELWPLKLILGLVDLTVILLLLKLAKPNAVLLYAWSPLIIKEFVITAHPDILGVMFILLALIAQEKHKLFRLGAFMAIACGVKIFAIMVLPFLLRFEWKAWLSFMLTALLIALPFGITEAWLPGGLSSMGASWLFNAPVYSLAESTIGHMISLQSLKLSLIAILALGCASYLLHYLRKGTDVIAHRELHGDLLYLALFLCAPAFNAWYLVWLLVFAVLRPSLWAWVLSLTIFLSYASGINLENATELEPYEHWGWILSVEFLPPMMALFWLLGVKTVGKNKNAS